MKVKLSLVLALTTVLFAGLAIYFSQRSGEERARTATLRRKIEEQAERVHDLEVSKDRLNNQGRELIQRAQERAIEASRQPDAAALSSSAASKGAARAPGDGGTGGEKGSFAAMFSEIMKDPAAKKMIRDQQRLMMGSLYAPLIKQLGLSPEQADKFKELLSDQATKATERTTSLLAGSSGSNRTEVVATLAAETKAHQDEVRQLLGEAGYDQYQEYQQTVGERLQLNLFKQQAGSEAALTDPQTEQLLTIMKEEKKSLQAIGHPVPGAGQDAANLQALMTEGQSEQMLQAQESINERVFERAKPILSAEQLAGFGRFQTNQLEMMRMGLTMARKFLGPEPSSGPSAPAP